MSVVPIMPVQTNDASFAQEGNASIRSVATIDRTAFELRVIRQIHINALARAAGITPKNGDSRCG